MFVGHVALALAAKRRVPALSLGWLVGATLLLDILWPLFVLQGSENFVILPDGAGFERFAFTWYPWSHSLVMALVWALLAAGAAMLFRAGRQAAVVLALLVFSHWVLDWITHAPDLAIHPGLDQHRMGLHLWGSTLWTFIIEGALYAAGVWLYLTTTRAKDLVGVLAFWGLIGVFTFLWASVPFAPPPPSESMIAWTGAVGMPVFMLWAWWADRHRGVA